MAGFLGFVSISRWQAQRGMLMHEWNVAFLDDSTGGCVLSTPDRPIVFAVIQPLVLSLGAPRWAENQLPIIARDDPRRRSDRYTQE